MSGIKDMHHDAETAFIEMRYCREKGIETNELTYGEAYYLRTLHSFYKKLLSVKGVHQANKLIESVGGKIKIIKSGNLWVTQNPSFVSSIDHLEHNRCRFRKAKMKIACIELMNGYYDPTTLPQYYKRKKLDADLINKPYLKRWNKP